MTTEDEMVGWHHRLNVLVFEQALGDGEGQESLACCSPRGLEELDVTEPQNNPPPSTRKLKLIPQTLFRLNQFYLSSFVNVYLVLYIFITCVDSCSQNHTWQSYLNF